MPYTYTGVDSSFADGYGTLMLPDTIIQNVLRIKTVLTDSTPTTTPGLIFTRRLVAYYFFTPNYHANIFALQDVFNTYTLNGVILPAFSTESKIIYRAANTNAVLPLKIVSFNADLKGKDVLLQWQTANELNTNFFNIQRSSDGLHFNTINKVLTSANTTSTKNYSYSDARVDQLGVPRLYYRLQEVDKDGKGNNSLVRKVSLSDGHSLFSISPNPSKDFINIVSYYNVANVQVRVTDMNAKTLYLTSKNLNAGQSFKIAISKFSSGVLIVTIKTCDITKQFEVVKE